jgi:hypothetical protein
MRTELGLGSGLTLPLARGWAAGWTGGALLAALLVAAPLRAAVPEPPAPPSLRALPALALLQDQADRVLTGDHTVAAGESVADIVVVGGDLRVRGEITGDAVVVGGNLIMEEGGTVLGDALVTGGEILDRGGRIRGEMRMLSESGAEISDEIREAILERDAAREAAREARREARVRVDRHAERSWFDPIKRGFAGLISTVALGLVLAGIGAALIFYGRPYLDTVSDTLRASTMRSMGVGLAAGFLVIPAFVILVVALAVSIVGIPLLLLAVPLYPLAIAAGVALGLLAAAHAIGERTAEQRSDAFDLRHRNAYAYLFTGLGMLLTPLLAASLIQMTGFLNFVGTLLQVVTWAVIWAAATAGFGAVILSRLGTRRTFASPLDEPTLDRDPLFDDEPSSRGPYA